VLLWQTASDTWWSWWTIEEGSSDCQNINNYNNIPPNSKNSSITLAIFCSQTDQENCRIQLPVTVTFCQLKQNQKSDDDDAEQKLFSQGLQSAKL